MREATPIKRSLQFYARLFNDAAGRRRLYPHKNQHACRLAHDEQIGIAAYQTGGRPSDTLNCIWTNGLIKTYQVTERSSFALFRG